MDRDTRLNLLLMFGISGCFVIILVAFYVGNSLLPPPTIVDCQLSPGPNENGWYNSSVTATTHMSDGSLYDWLTGKPPVYVAVTQGEGRQVPLYLFDDYGIASAGLITLGFFDIDYTPPATDIVTYRNDDSSVTVTLTANDMVSDYYNAGMHTNTHADMSREASGVKSVTYRINGEDPVVENGEEASFTVANNSHIEFYATDYAGNTEAPQNDEVLVD